MHETVAESFDIRPETLVVVFDSNFVRVVVKEEHVDREKSHEAKHFIVLHRQAFVLLDQNWMMFREFLTIDGRVTNSLST